MTNPIMPELRVYGPEEINPAGKYAGYPIPWGLPNECGIKDLVRAAAGHRCVRCGHPYRTGVSKPAWSPCDELCTHDGPIRVWVEVEGGPAEDAHWWETTALKPVNELLYNRIEAAYRVLTTHHLNGNKADCRWWNLASLCQRCHLTIQGRVKIEQIYPHEHTPWFKPYAAGYYAWAYLGEELTREETEARLDELLALEPAAVDAETAAA